MSRILVRKQDGQPPSMMMGSSGGGFGNIMYNLPSWVTPEEAVYGKFSQPDKEGNVRQISPGALDREENPTREQAEYAEKLARRLGTAGMLVGGGLGGLSALYNLTSSGQPLDLSGASSIGTAAYTGGRTAQPYSTTLGARVGVRRGRGMGMSNTTAMMPLNDTSIADPRGRGNEPIDVEFTETEHTLDEPNAQMLPSPQGLSTYDQTRVASPTVRKPVKVTGDPVSRIQSDFGDPVPDETMDRIMERFG